MGGLKKGNSITFVENGLVCQTHIFVTSITLKTALSLIREFCLKIDWCLGVYNHEASNRVFESKMIDLKM